MTDREQIKQVFQNFVDGGLVSQDIDEVLRCISDQIIGIGIGEQGFVLSKEDIREVLRAGIRKDDFATYSLDYDQLHILIHGETFANACGEITVNRMENGVLTTSKLLQSLVFLKDNGVWKICGLHASAPVVTEDNMDAYPLKVAEKMLCSLREEIGEKAYLAEEQFQQAVLADTIAFYIVNFSKDRFEKCQTDGALCAYVEPGTSYNQFVLDNIQNYMSDRDRKRFLKKFSLANIRKAIEKDKKEIKCEYTLQRPDGGSLWAVTVIRLIIDCITGDHKGIMYVKDIDKQKRREIEMRAQAECDSMTGLYHRTAFAREVEKVLSRPAGMKGALIMLDVDKFKTINDTFGHPFGDRVLSAAAELLQEQFQDNCILGRLGGDEFGIFAAGKSPQELADGPVRELMEKFHRIQTPSPAAFQISCSIGIAGAREVRSFEQLYQQADQALYRSKQDGRDRCTVYV